MSDKVTFGISEVAVASVTVTEGVTTYGTPVKIPGAMQLTLTPKNTEIKLEADNDPNYFATTSNDGYDAELTMAKIPDTLKTGYMGYEADADGSIGEDVTALPKPFALLYQVEGDAEGTRHIFYNCVPSRGTKTEKSGKTPEGETIPMLIKKPEDSKFIKFFSQKSVDATKYDAWYTAVQIFNEGV